MPWKKRKIIIFGDYDVDGITSTSILFDFLKKVGANVGYYIPDRKEEGYGLSIIAVDKVIDDGASLIITVDCGITAFEEVRHIIESHVDIIITDHHECKEELPEAYALINPCRHDCSYPFKELAGVGVVFKLVKALCIKMGLTDESVNYLDLVALGTVADVVPLIEENRVIVKYGLQKIENTLNTGLKALIDVSGSKDKQITSYVIGFVLAPRINAAGRIGDASRAVRLLTTDNEDEAAQIAKELSEQNTYRQETEHNILCEVMAGIEQYVDLDKEKVIVVWGKGWHHGIIGIVASKITESYNRPCILITVEDGMGKGSGRSIEEFNLFKALMDSSSLLEKFGGHELAAGLTIKEDNIQEFKTKINAYANSILNDSDLVPKVKIDIEVSKEDISEESVRQLDLMSPFGAGNPSPVFAYRNLVIKDIRAVGNNKHIKITFRDKETDFDAIGFSRGYLAEVYSESDILDAACSLEINSWNNRESVQLNIKDLKVCEDTLLQNEYFYSLDNAIDFKNGYDDNKINSFLDRLTVVGLLEEFGQVGSQVFPKNRKLAILLNSVNSLKTLTSKLKSINMRFKVFYNEIDIFDDNEVCLVVNAQPGKFNESRFDKVMIYGEWICRNYLHFIVSGIDVDRIFILDKICFEFTQDDIIVERRDMVAVYQYIRSNFKSDFIIEDLFRFANAVSKSYRINMNYFKVKRIIETFEELNLLKKSEHGKYGMTVSMLDTGGKKADLESSDMFQSFKAFKERISMQRKIIS